MSNQDTSLFTNNTEVPNQGTSNSQTSSDPIADLLAQIKNEKGEPKYGDVNQALNGLKHSQEFIPKLQMSLKEKEEEIERLRKEAEKVAELERVIESYTQSNSSTPPKETPQSTTPPVDITSVVEKVLSQREQARVAKTNADLVVQKVSEVFGAEAEKKFYGKAQELGMSVAEFNALAAKSPKSVLELLGIKSDTPTPKTVTSSVNTAGFVPSQQTFITKNSKPFSVGATSQDVYEELTNARKLVEELHGSGKTINDLTNPKTFFKHFG